MDMASRDSEGSQANAGALDPVAEAPGSYLRAGSTVYTLMQKGWRKGEPVMVNEITIQVSVDPANGLDAETVAGWVRDAMNAREAARDDDQSWTVHDGGAQPLTDSTMLDIELDDGSIMCGCRADYWEWDHALSEPKIVRYRLAAASQAA